MVVNGIEKRYNKRKQMNGEMIMALINCPDCGKQISSQAASFHAVSGKCYEARYCKPGLAFWETQVREVSVV